MSKLLNTKFGGHLIQNADNETIHKNYVYGLTTYKFLNEQGLNLWANINYIVMNHKWMFPCHFKIRNGL